MMVVDQKRDTHAYRLSTTDAMLAVVFHKLRGPDSGGILVNPHIPYDIPFSGYGDLLLKLERIYDLLDMPQAAGEPASRTDAHSWAGTGLETAAGWNMGVEAWKMLSDIHLPDKGTIYIQTLYRQNHSLQGFVFRGSREKRRYYRSALELLHLLDAYIRDQQ